MNIVEWINQNVYHTTSCDKHRRILGQKCICGKDKCISELSKPIIEHPDVQKLIKQIVILQKQNDLLTLGLLQEKNKVAALNKKIVAQAAYVRELEAKQP